MSEHTEGPWEIDIDGCMEVCIGKNTQESRSIASVPRPEDYQGWESWKVEVIARVRRISYANLKLIAAAPEMFDLLSTLSKMDKDCDLNDIMPQILHVLKKADTVAD